MSENNNKLQSISALLQTIGLQSSEKTTARNQLAEHIDTNKPTRWVDITRLVRLSFGRAAVGVAVVLIMVGGITYAAQDSLPGSPLYVVKTNINEPFMSMAAWSDSRRAQTESTLAARRISELQELLNADNLTTSTSDKLLSRISDHTQAAREEITELEMTADTKDEQAEELRTRLQALLAVEGQKMQKWLDTSTTSTSSENRIAQRAGQILTDLAQQHQDADEGQVSATSAKRITDLPAGGQAVMNLLRVTSRQMQSSYNAYLQYNDPKQSPPPNELVSAAYALESGIEHIKAKEHSQALSDLEEALDELEAHASDRSYIAIQASTTKVATSGGSSTDIATSTQGAGTDSSSVGLPTRQALHNNTIQDALRMAKELLDTYSFDTTKENVHDQSESATSSKSNSSSTPIQEKKSTTTSQNSISTSSTSKPETNDESAM